MSTATSTHNFGLDPEAVYHFQVVLSKHEATIAEVYDRPVVKAAIPRAIWDAIADLIKAEWNMRLTKYKQKTGRWSKSTTLLDRCLGKELTLLAWALEDAAPDAVEDIFRNWKGLAPEERWWLFTTTNATSNLPTFGKDRGWRKAIRIAFSENS